MWCNQTFSIIKPVMQEDNTVKNIIANVIVCDNFEVANQVAKGVFGETSYAIDSTDYAVSIGYEYKDGNFYNLNNELIVNSKTQEKQQLEDLIVLVADLIGGAL